MRPSQITDTHLARLALVYIRQSTNEQLRVNTGSTALQRDLPSMLQEWGWPPDRIRVLDDDLGKSGSIPGHREGFAHLLEQMGSGTVGLVAAIDSSRLARNLQDFAAFDAAARDHDVLFAVGSQVFDLRDPNVAFVSTIFGANAARENRARVEQSIRTRRKKAERGIAVTMPPVGYVASADGNWIKDPDPRVRDVIQLIFDKFIELRSTGAVCRFFRRRGILLPARMRREGRTWVPAKRSEIYRILKHPAYAGIYAYGLTEREPSRDGRVRRHVVRRAQGRWVVTRDHHEPYIEPILWEHIEDRLASNKQPLRRPPGRGEALLQGMLKCARHTHMFGTLYTSRERRPDAPTKRAANYWCHQNPITGDSTVCGKVRARRIDTLVESEVLETLVPPSVDVLEEARREAMREFHVQQRAREDEFRRAQQAVDQAERAFDQTDADHVHLKKRLEKRLEDTLQQFEQLTLAQQARPLHPPLTLDETELAELRGLLGHLPSLWRHPNVTPEQRKALVRRVIKTVHAIPGPHTWALEIEWVGGARTSLTLLTTQGVEAELRRMEAQGLTASEILEHLNQRGIVQMSGRAAGKPYTKQRLRSRMRRLAHKSSRKATGSARTEPGDS